MRIRPSGAGKIRGAGRVAPGVTPIEAGQPGAGYTKLPDNSYVLQADIEAIQQKWPEGYKILTEQGFTAYQEALTSAKETATKQASATTNIKAKYSALSEKQKAPISGYAYGGGQVTASFDRILTLSRTATDIPQAPGFYSVSTSKKVKGETIQVSDPTGGTRVPFAGPSMTVPHKTVSFTKEDTKTTTYVYARLEDGSVVLVDKSTKTVAGGGPVWVTNAQTGARLAVTRAVYEKSYAGPFFGATHEQKLGAQKLSKEKGVPYEQALGLVSASGYYDPEAIVKLPGPTGYGIYDPKTGKRVWGAYTPEVASAIKKLKPFENKDGTYDWSKIVATKDTQVAIAATQAFGFQPGALGAIKQSIESFPDLGPALKQGWDQYDAKLKELTIVLGDGSVLARSDYNDLSQDYQDIAVQQGYKQMITAMDADMAKLKPYEVPDKPGEYNVIQAIIDSKAGKFEDGVVQRVYGDKVYNELEPTADALIKLDKEGNAPLWALYQGNMTPEEVKQAMGDQADPYITQWQEYKDAKAEFKVGHRWGAAELVGPALTSLAFTFGAAVEGVASKLAPLDQSATLLSNAPLRFLVKIPIGAVSATLMGGGMVLSYIVGLPTHLTTPNYTSHFAQGIVEGFKGMAREIAIDPAGGVGKAIGFVLGAQGVTNMVKGIAARGSPWYIPNTGMRYTFTTGKISIAEFVKRVESGIIDPMALARAIERVQNRAMLAPEGVARARIGRTGVSIVIEPTPVSRGLGGALWRATPDRSPYKALEHTIEVKGQEAAEFYSLQAAPRFAMSSAHGRAATKPALIMVYTKSGQLTAYPTSVSYAKSLSLMESRGFDYLGSGRAKSGAYAPIKTYAGQFENEAMLPNGMTIFREQNLRSRLLGAGAGEFVTTVDGWVLPVYRFVEKGATVPKADLATLAAIRVNSLIHGIRVLLGKKGFKLESGYAEINTLVRQFELIGKAAMSGLKGAVAERAYSNAVERAMREKIDAVYREANANGVLDRSYRERPEVYERAYLDRVVYSLARVDRYKTSRDLYRADSSYTTARAQGPRRETARYTIERMARELRTARTARTTRTVRAVRAARVERQPYRDITIRRTTRPTVPPRIPVPPRRTITTPGKRLALPRDEGEGKEAIRVPLWSIAWRQGAVWKYVPPPWDQPKPITLSQAPIGAVKTGNKTPRDTIQLIGKPNRRSKIKVPESASVDLGVVDILVTKYGRAIEFKGQGEKTVVGQRIAGATTGMSIPASAPLKVKGIRGTSKESLRKLVLGTSVNQLIAEVYPAKVPTAFAEKLLAEKLAKLTPKEIAKEVTLADTDATRQAEILKMLPDRVRITTKFWIDAMATKEVAPVRGAPVAWKVAPKLRRKKTKTKAKKIPTPLPGISMTR